jgi:outer membrane biosynthesis protein TonB
VARKREDAEKEGRDRIPYVGSAAVHVLAFALAIWASMSDPPVLNAITYQIDIVSPPATSPDPVEDVPPEPEEELVVEEPDPEPVVEEEEAIIEPEPEPEEVEVPESEPEPPPAPTEPEEEPREPAATEVAETEQSGEDLRVRMEGLQRDFPVYYENIIVQIRRCLRWQGPPNLDAQVYFVIRRDGTVDGRDLDITRESGNIRFDYAAMAAVECAGQGRFGPLPDELPYDQLPVLMNFQPPG